MAGNAKVGNASISGPAGKPRIHHHQNFERAPFDLFPCRHVVPSHRRMAHAPSKPPALSPIPSAEAADLTMNLLEQGLRVDYEDRSLASLKRPSTPVDSLRQRFRWSFGTLQAIWKHRAPSSATRHGSLRAAQYPHLPNVPAAGVSPSLTSCSSPAHHLFRPTASISRFSLLCQLRKAAGSSS